MIPIIELHSRVYLTAIGMEIPSGQKETGEESFAPGPARPGLFSRLLAWLTAAIATPEEGRQDREELSLEASRWLGL
ncbi:hypothetical protein [Aestuariivirga sp.]|uniref:hypothetical protein n=1 Tax=Aestuariivirga sp. TaxID=2650926 RepID=UPI00391D04B3